MLRVLQSLLSWICQSLLVEAVALRDIGLRDAEDEEIFAQAKSAGVVMMTKDSDFLGWLDRYGPPPQVLWLTCGNTSNVHLKQILSATLAEAITLLNSGERLIEVSDA